MSVLTKTYATAVFLFGGTTIGAINAVKSVPEVVKTSESMSIIEHLTTYAQGYGVIISAIGVTTGFLNFVLIPLINHIFKYKGPYNRCKDDK